MPSFSRTIGIEIGAESVKVARLAERRGTIRAVQFAEQSLPTGYRWEVGGDHQPVVEAIRAAFIAAGIRGKTAVISMPRGQVTARISAFPKAEPAELRRVVEYDLADHIPFPVEQVVLDMQQLGASREQPGLVDVLIVAAPRELVHEYLRLAEELGLKVAALTVDALALDDLAGLLEREPAGMVVTLDVGARATTINVTEQRRLRLTRSVAIGGRQLLRAVQDDLGVSQEEAERLLSSQGLQVLERDPKPTRVQAWLDGLLGEIRRSALSFGPAALSRLVLVGTEAHLPGLAQRLATELQVEPLVPTVADVLPEASISPAPPEALDSSLTTIGTALRAVGRSRWELSLLPREVLESRRRGKLRTLVAACVVIGVLALAGLYLQTLRTVDARRAEVASLEPKEVAARERAAEAQSLLDERDRLEEQMAALRKVQVRRYAALELLNTIAFYGPENIVLTNFTWRPEQDLQLRGRAPTSAVVADLQSAIAESPLVTRVDLSGADLISGRKTTDEYLSFSLDIALWTEGTAKAESGSLRPWREDQ
ncbi:MAG: type IV pilus assembly protein PilM [Armatimonadetes bacterium]|nr:type IV pilus assembly protein PilM [Armatimonadota bacterium]